MARHHHRVLMAEPGRAVTDQTLQVLGEPHLGGGHDAQKVSDNLRHVEQIGVDFAAAKQSQIIERPLQIGQGDIDAPADVRVIFEHPGVRCVEIGDLGTQTPAKIRGVYVQHRLEHIAALVVANPGRIVIELFDLPSEHRSDDDRSTVDPNAEGQVIPHEVMITNARFETPDQLAAARKEAFKSGKNYKYNRAGRDLTEQQIKQYEDQRQLCTIRFATPDRAITVNDMVLGNVTVQPQQLDDFIILKSDGFPTFHLAVVIDDKLMGITHILRGQEHLINTPKHIALQEALGFDRPAYAHMPLIFNMDGSKMSKRDKEKALKKGLPAPDIDVHDFRKAGYLPEALLNFIALLGWSPGQDRELMTLGEMTELFSIDRIGKTNAKFDRDKLQAFNADYINSASDQRLLEAVSQFPELADYPLKEADDQMLLKLFPLYRPRAKTLRELAQASSLFFLDKVTYDPKAVKKVLRKGQGAEVLALAAEQLPKLQQWTVAE